MTVYILNPTRKPKLNPKFEGPFEVIIVNKSDEIILKDVDNMLLKHKYVSQQLKKCIVNKTLVFFRYL